MYTSTKSHTTATFLQGALGAPVRHVNMSKPGQYPGEGTGLTLFPRRLTIVNQGARPAASGLYISPWLGSLVF